MLRRSYIMKRTKLVIAALILAVLFAFKAFFPELTDNLIEGTKAVFSYNRDYRQVLNEIGDGLDFFRDSDEKILQSASSIPEISAKENAQIEHGSSSTAELASEFGVSEGEDVQELPAAVAAFLESQKLYSEYDLPEKVSYDYYEFNSVNTTPVKGMNSSGFGYRTHPIHGDIRFHYGTDFAAWTGENIYAFADGEVSFAGYCDSFGNYLTIEHSDGWKSLYAHCSALCVEEGDEVSAGDKIALVGDTGLVTGPHLHFELSKNGVYVNPEYYVN